MMIYLDDGFGAEVEVPEYMEPGIVAGAPIVQHDGHLYERTGLTWAGLRVYRPV